MPHRYFTNELAAGRAALTGSDAHHLADVMRAKLGEEVVLCGPDGLEYLGTVTAIQSGRVEFTVTKGTTSKAEPDAAVTLFAGYPKQGKLEEVIRHSVELGVTEIVPFFSRYCVATPKKEDAKNERYNRIAAEAAKQAGRAMLPHVSMPLLNFAAVCDALQEDYDLALFFYEGGGAPLRTVLRPGCAKKIAIVTGSEGGFSVEEAEAAKAAGAASGNYRLGGGVLVVTLEPCAMCAAALVHARLAGVVYGAADRLAGAVTSCSETLDQPFFNHRVWHMGGVLARESVALLQDFFAGRRD